MTPVEEQNLRTFQKKVAEAIDFGTEHGSKAMAEPAGRDGARFG